MISSQPPAIGYNAGNLPHEDGWMTLESTRNRYVAIALSIPCVAQITMWPALFANPALLNNEAFAGFAFAVYFASWIGLLAGVLLVSLSHKRQLLWICLAIYLLTAVLNLAGTLWVLAQPFAFMV
jgi:hypothetical protein